jgi:EAL domain-containing protein (putative c-di-GMP-specific phosphodiesterase class I)
MFVIESQKTELSSIQQQLESALKYDQFELHYQPLINIGDRSIRGVEALIRWRHPQRGLLLPAQFIDAAEKTGLIVPIGNWVLRQACIDHRALQLISPHHLLLSVNVSARQLDDSTFIAALAGIVRETRVPSKLLQLEITESVFLADSPRIGAIFHAIRALGVKIAFDDFGTGYSSLTYLENYPVDLIKIDQFFVQRMHKSYTQNEVVRLIVNLAHAFRMDICAEGVETLEQADVLSGFGCTMAQGYLYSHPLPVNQVAALLEQTPAGDPSQRFRPRHERSTWASSHFARRA